MLKESLLEVSDLGGVQFVKESSDTTVDDGNLLLGGSIKIRAKLCEGSDLTVLGKLKLHGTGHLLHRLSLGGGTDTGHRQTDVNGGTDTLVEQLSLQEDLSVSDRDDIGGDISRHITGLGLNNRQGSQ